MLINTLQNIEILRNRKHNIELLLMELTPESIIPEFNKILSVKLPYLNIDKDNQWNITEIINKINIVNNIQNTLKYNIIAIQSISKINRSPELAHFKKISNDSGNLILYYNNTMELNNDKLIKNNNHIMYAIFNKPEIVILNIMGKKMENNKPTNVNLLEMTITENKKLDQFLIDNYNEKTNYYLMGELNYWHNYTGKHVEFYNEQIKNLKELMKKPKSDYFANNLQFANKYNESLSVLLKKSKLYQINTQTNRKVYIESIESQINKFYNDYITITISKPKSTDLDTVKKLDGLLKKGNLNKDDEKYLKDQSVSYNTQQKKWDIYGKIKEFNVKISFQHKCENEGKSYNILSTCSFYTIHKCAGTHVIANICSSGYEPIESTDINLNKLLSIINKLVRETNTDNIQSNIKNWGKIDKLFNGLDNTTKKTLIRNIGFNYLSYDSHQFPLFLNHKNQSDKYLYTFELLKDLINEYTNVLITGTDILKLVPLTILNEYNKLGDSEKNIYLRSYARIPVDNLFLIIKKFKDEELIKKIIEIIKTKTKTSKIFIDFIQLNLFNLGEDEFVDIIKEYYDSLEKKTMFAVQLINEICKIMEIDVDRGKENAITEKYNSLSEFDKLKYHKYISNYKKITNDGILEKNSWNNETDIISS